MQTANAPGYRQAAPTPAISPVDAFEAGLRQVAQQLLATVPDLTQREKDWLYDMAREECRYPMPTVRKLCAVSRRSRRADVREAFAELIRSDSTPIGEAMPVKKAFDLETPAPGMADVEQRAFETNPNPITWQRCKDALQRQLAVTKAALCSVVASRPAGDW